MDGLHAVNVTHNYPDAKKFIVKKSGKLILVDFSRSRFLRDGMDVNGEDWESFKEQDECE
jgi:hypothetical protein